MTHRPLVLTLLLATAACAPGTETPAALRSGGGGGLGVSAAPLPIRPESPCEDGDGDGFGRGCEAGDDCDDQDPDAAEVCGRCETPATGCACGPREEPLPCDADTDHDVSAATCWLGQRTCVEGAWSRCTPYAPRFR